MFVIVNRPVDRIASINIKRIKELAGLLQYFDVGDLLFARSHQFDKIMDRSKFQLVGNNKNLEILFRRLLKVKANLSKVIRFLNAHAGKTIIFFRLF